MKPKKLRLLIRYNQVLQVYNQHKATGLTDKRIHKEFIYPAFSISKRTLDYILSPTVKKQLNEITKEQNATICIE